MLIWLKKHIEQVKVLVFLVALIPGGLLAWEAMTGRLGVNPLESLMRRTGIWAFNFLLLTLAITPSRRVGATFMQWRHAKYGKRLSDWNFLIRLRRMLGMYCFFYAGVHLMFYLWLDAGFAWSAILPDLLEKRYIDVGWLSFLLLVPLAMTSLDSAVRAMGRHSWRRLHRLIYGIAILVTLHYLWLVKHGNYDPWWYAVAVVVLLGYRVAAALGVFRLHDEGMEIPERPAEATMSRVPK